jgi:DUF1009 family protein
MDKRIGIIAGSGQFPFIFARAARDNGYAVYAVAHVNETGEDLDQYVDEIKWVRLGQLKKIIKFFSGHGVRQAVMAGAIKKTNMFRDVRPDLKTISILAGIKNTHDDRLLRAFADALEKEGILIKASTFLLPDLLAPVGCWTKKKPTRSENEDIRLGWQLAKEIGRLDIGQCVVVGGGSVLAVEAIDGTDATIKRGGALARGAAVVVKVCKPNQDFRFDVPAIGVNTIKGMADVGVKVLVIEAGKAVVFDRREMIHTADELGVCIVARDDAL